MEGTATETLLKTRNSKPPSHQALQTTKKSPLWNIELFLAPLTTASVWNLQFKSVQKQAKNSIQGIFRNKHGSTRPSGRRDRLLTSTVAQNVWLQWRYIEKQRRLFLMKTTGESLPSAVFAEKFTVALGLQPRLGLHYHQISHLFNISFDHKNNSSLFFFLSSHSHRHKSEKRRKIYMDLKWNMETLNEIAVCQQNNRAKWFNYWNLIPRVSHYINVFNSKIR